MADTNSEVQAMDLAAPAGGVAPPGPPETLQVLATEALNTGPRGDPQAGGFAEIGVSGLKVYSGTLNEEYLKELRGPKAVKVFQAMSESDSTVSAMLTAISLMLRAVDWKVAPADDGTDGGNFSAAAEAEAEFCKSLFDDMSHTLEDTIGEILSFLVYGWSYHEIVLKIRRGPDEEDGAFRSQYEDGRVGIRKLPIRSQDSLLRWQMQDDGGIDGMWQQPPSGGQQLFIPIERALLFRTNSKKNSPEGTSILRAAYRDWYLKKNVEDMEAVGVERELAGLPVVTIPAAYLNKNATAEQKAVLERAQKIARDIKFNQQGGVVMPSDLWASPTDGGLTNQPLMDVKLLTTGGRRAIETGPIVDRYTRGIVRSALADFLTLGDTKGSYALSKNKSEMFLRACESYLNSVASVFNRFLIPRLWAYNGIDRALMPKMAPGRIAPVDLNELGAYLQALSASGMPLFPDPELESYTREAGGLPEASVDFAVRHETANLLNAGDGITDDSEFEDGSTGSGGSK